MTTMSQLVVALASLVSLSGCTITAVSAEADTRASNQCGSDADCPNGNCRAGICQALNGELESLLVEVTPPADSKVPHLPLRAHLEDVPTSGGAMLISLTRAAHVVGSLKLGDGSACQPTFYDEQGLAMKASTDGRSLPVAVTLSPRERLLGLSAQVYTTTTSDLDAKGNYTFELQVPAGDYDVYVAPPRTQSGCDVAPQLFRRQPIAGGEVELQYPVSAAKSLKLEVHWPAASGNLDGWVADIIEPVTGRSISSQFVLQRAVGSATLQYSVPLAHSEVSEVGTVGSSSEAATALVRLTPPPTLVAPTVFLDRSGLGLFSTDTVVLDGFTRFPDAVTVEGQVARLEDGKPAQGQVTLVSSEITGVDLGIFASFQRTVPVAPDGRFVLAVPPGKYRVYAVPPIADGLAASEISWDIPADVAYQAGKLIELSPTTSVTGRCALEGAQVQALASPQSVLPFEQAFGAAVFVPRANPGLVGPDGGFTLQADPGAFDISVRPPESLGFAWFVRPSVQVGTDIQELGTLTLPKPSVVTGSVEVTAAGSSSAAIPSALIRAYAYLDDDLAYTRDVRQATSVIQVAETRADEAGAFRLLIPPSIAAAR